MMRVTLMIIEDEDDEQQIVGDFVLEGKGPVRMEAASEDGVEILSEVLSERLFVHGSKGDYVTAQSDPEAWLRELPFAYNGTRLRAEFQED